MSEGLGGMPPVPLNAPGAQQAAGGVQPGQSNAIVVADKVIVFGPAGGMFVYNGTPGLGNPPIFWATSATVDPYGNAIPQNSTAGIAGMGTFVAGNTLISPSGLAIYSATPARNNLIASAASAQFTDPFGNVVLAGVSAYNPGSGLAFFTEMVNGGINIGVSTGADETTGWTQQVSGLGSTANGILQYANVTDGNTYKAGRVILLSGGSQPIISTSPVVVSNMSIAVLTGFVYHFTFMTIVSPDQGAGGASFGFDGSSVSGNANGYGEWKQNQTVPNLQVWDGSLGGLSGSHTFTLGIEQVWVAEIWAVFTTPGTFNLRAQETTAGDSFHIKSSIMRMELT